MRLPPPVYGTSDSCQDVVYQRDPCVRILGPEGSCVIQGVGLKARHLTPQTCRLSWKSKSLNYVAPGFRLRRKGSGVFFVRKDDCFTMNALYLGTWTLWECRLRFQKTDMVTWSAPRSPAIGSMQKTFRFAAAACRSPLQQPRRRQLQVFQKLPKNSSVG